MPPFRVLSLVTSVVLAARALGAQASAPPAGPIPAHDTLVVRSRALGERRLVNVHVPPGYAGGAARFPVLYMPDGGVDEDFPHVVRTVDSLIAARAIRPVLVVGVPNTERRRDLTGPTHVAADSAVAPHVGGSAAFRRFLREELVPAVDARYRTTGERAIVGESLAGLFVVETLLREPALFDHYVAFDPSLWWDGGALVDSARSRLASLATLGTGRRTLYVVQSRDDRNDDAARFGAVLRASTRPGLRSTFVARPDLTHATVFRAAEAAALADALR
jgi:predicted alpha/beta superfamily hydrolase